MTTEASAADRAAGRTGIEARATAATESRPLSGGLGVAEWDLMRGQCPTVWFGDFSQTRTRRLEDHPNGADARFASLRAVDLGETPECKLAGRPLPRADPRGEGVALWPLRTTGCDADSSECLSPCQSHCGSGIAYFNSPI